MGRISKKVVLIVIGIIFLKGMLNAQFSPGELAMVHSFLEGTKNCTQCHEVGGKSLSNGCVECHTPIKMRIDQNRGFHKDKQEDCGKCHPDHNSREFKLVHWEKGEKNFDHLNVGFDLTGEHKNLECRKCHIEKNIVESSVISWINKYPNEPISERTLLGVANTCNGCHEDIHRGEVSQDCASCHTTKDWKQSRNSFNHDLAKFQLIGEHKKVDCEECHVVDQLRKPPIMQLTDLEYQTCGSCHTDIHKGAYGNKCEKCHTTEKGWIKNLIPFDHNETEYPLQGLHINQDCMACHTEELAGLLPSFKQCSDCHVDKHGGQFVERNDKGACESCHTVDGFIPTTYSFADHDQSRFKLDGSHFAIPCVLCHKPIEDGSLINYAQFKWAVLQCNSCHTDVHRKQFTQRNNPLLCKDCHTTQTFLMAKFDHEKTNFPLDGEHINVSCTKCHLPEKDWNGVYIRYEPIPHKCENCHSFNEKKS
ncbi:MAG: hypothetical protein HOD18_01760 [Candidatus Marinimicrobia bacterium]|nr:hypothetical protein [Candidatus Neomarinimicrobiota bacterium]